MPRSRLARPLADQRQGMGFFVFVEPTPDRLHLHERLQRELHQRAHRCEAVFTLPERHALFVGQGLPATCVDAAQGRGEDGPWPEFADAELRRLAPTATGRWRRRRLGVLARRCAQLAPALRTRFAQAAPDLLLLHQERSLSQRVASFVARELGLETLWTGEGLLPHTQQHDARGLDGDAASVGRDPFVVREYDNEPALLRACLVHALARSEPVGLSRRTLVRPDLATRWRCTLRALARDGWPAARRAWRAWHDAGPQAPLPPLAFDLPAQPFVALLLQEADDARVCLDATAPANATSMAIGVHGAMRALDPQLELVVVAPGRGLAAAEAAAIAALPRTRIAPAHAAPDAACSAIATATVNHPLATVALLAGHPVLHTGQALYGLVGVTWRRPLAAFPAALATALQEDNATLRERFLSQLLTQQHLWCSATQPDHNGMLGLTHLLERRIRSRGPQPPRTYRTGPAWPLSADERG